MRQNLRRRFPEESDEGEQKALSEKVEQPMGEWEKIGEQIVGLEG